MDVDYPENNFEFADLYISLDHYGLIINIWLTIVKNGINGGDCNLNNWNKLKECLLNGSEFQGTNRGYYTNKGFFIIEDVNYSGTFNSLKIPSFIIMPLIDKIIEICECVNNNIDYHEIRFKKLNLLQYKLN